MAGLSGTSALSGVPYANVISVEGGVREGCGDRGPTATVRYFVNYTDRWNFAKAVLGTSFPAGLAATRTIPVAYPPWPVMYALAITEMAGIGKPISVDGQLISSYAAIDVQYGVPPYRFDGSDPSGVPWSSTSMTVGFEQYPAPTSVYTFPSGSVMENSPMIPIPTAEISILRKWLPFWPGSITQGLTGLVNSGTFLGYAAGTLMFMGADLPEPTSDPVGNYVYDCTYRFSWRYIPWNAELDPDGTSGWAVPLDGNGNPKIASGDFTVLP